LFWFCYIKSLILIGLSSKGFFHHVGFDLQGFEKMVGIGGNCCSWRQLVMADKVEGMEDSWEGFLQEHVLLSCKSGSGFKEGLV
jgi:hypothetical protein